VLPVQFSEEGTADSAAHVHDNAITNDVAPDPPTQATVAPPPVNAPQTAPPDPHFPIQTNDSEPLTVGQSNMVNSGKAAIKKNSKNTKHTDSKLIADAPVGQRQSGRAVKGHSKGQ